jgi:hypothetical protein
VDRKNGLKMGSAGWQWFDQGLMQKNCCATGETSRQTRSVSDIFTTSAWSISAL